MNEVNRQPSAIEILRDAQRDVLLAHGPCCISCESLLDVKAAQLVQESALDAPARIRLMDEIRMILGIQRIPGEYEDHPVPA